jgi:glyoxylase-like metal-dependent hydrolase (beta-lactamase superfamily II)
MQIEKIVSPEMEVNTYIVYCPGAKVGFVIDPSYNVKMVINRINELKLDIKYIINTHAHIDHIVGNNQLHNSTNAPILIHENEGQWLVDPAVNPSSIILGNITSPPATQLLKDGDKVTIETKLGPLTLIVLHTPGHSPGSICLKFHRGIFVGDVIFEGSIGRTDFEGGDIDLMKKSLMRLWNDIPDAFEIFPGHMNTTVCEKEKKTNYLWRHMTF